MGVACDFVSLKIGDAVVKVRITDTAGQDRFRAIAESHLPSAKGVLIVFDVTDRESFAEVERVMKSIRAMNSSLMETRCVLLVGNKVDLVRPVPASFSPHVSHASTPPPPPPPQMFAMFMKVSERRVTAREASELANSLKLPYFETSARDGVGIDPPFQYLATRLLNTFPKELAGFSADQRGQRTSQHSPSSGRLVACSVM